MTLTAFWKILGLTALALVPGTLLLLPLWIAYRRRVPATALPAPAAAHAAR